MRFYIPPFNHFSLLFPSGIMNGFIGSIQVTGHGPFAFVTIPALAGTKMYYPSIV